MAIRLSAPNLLLPWSSTADEDRRYRKIFGFMLIPFFILGIAIPLIDVPEPKREELEKLPPQLAKLELEKKEIPKPPKPKPKPKPKKKVEKKPEKKKEPKKEKPKPKPKPKPKKEPAPAKLVEKAKKAAEAEINQFADDLMAMRESFDLSDVNDAPLTRSTGKAAKIDRAIVSSQAKRGSGGINTGKLSRNTGGVALSGKQTTKVKSKLASSTGKANKGKQAKARGGSYRSEEDIRKIFDQHKGSIFAVYNRALRKDPTLEGKVVFKIVIEANGRVSSVSIVSSDLNNPALERKLMAKIRMINFGVQNVVKTTLNYSFDFLPY